MKIETDLKKIKETAQKKETENWEFRSFLKGYDIEVEELDSIRGICAPIMSYAPKTAGRFRIFNKEEFVFRLISVIQNYAVCPIVFNVYERLKNELWHRFEQ